MKAMQLIQLSILLLISSLTFGQQKTITGTVSDNSGPLPGVSVVVKGTQRGVQTNVDGTYSIKASTGETLVYSFIGMRDISKVVGSSNVINVVMQEDSKVLSEVVVTALGIQKRNDKSSRRESKKRAISAAMPTTSVGYSKNYEADYSIQEKDLKVSEEYRKRHLKADSIKTNPNENEDYGVLLENEFESPKQSPLSTFSIDVDNASYTNIRRFINNGQKVPTDAVRVEEMMNFFKYNYAQPTGEHPFAIATDYSDCPWNPENKLVRIGLQGKNLPTETLPNSNFVFLVDVSGSMSDENKLPLLKESMKILVKELRPEDKVSIVVYAGVAGLVLPPTTGNKKETIINALEQLNAGGSTAGGEGIKLAYKIAEENFIKGGNNRVILATDGDFNVGASSDNDMERLIVEKRKSGVFLTCLGYGMGNYKDSKMETLADKGNGNYAYIDNIQEANRFLGKEFKGSMFAIAKDVKIQIEFNPKYVQSYRLIGYENRKLRPEDFKNDAIDAGELGSGHTVTALYEIIPTGVKSKYFESPSDLKYTPVTPKETAYAEELATIKFRYKKPDGEKSIEMVQVIKNTSTAIENTNQDFKFAAAVAWFGLKLRESKLIKEKSITDIVALAKQGIANDSEGYKAECIRLMENVRL